MTASRIRGSLAPLAALALSLLPFDARASSSDGWGIGIGTGFGFHSSSSPDNPGDSGPIADLNVRARFLWILGLDLRFIFHVGHIGQDSEPVTLDEAAQYAARYRTSLLLYVLPTPAASLYIGGGFGATDGADLLSPTAPGTSYQVGLGLEVPLSSRLALDASFMMLIPGQRSIERDIERRVELELAAYRAAPSTKPPEPPDDLPASDYITPSNFELMVRAMLVF